MITGKILQGRGWSEGRTIGLAKKLASLLEKRGLEREPILARLDAILADPESHRESDSSLQQTTQDEAKLTAELARELIQRRVVDHSKREDTLRPEPLPYRVWGGEGIDEGALVQMNNAMRLPVAAAGALMPDAHVGYGLPIGGVLATRDCVIPYAVGVDIACRMRLSIYDAPTQLIESQSGRLEVALREQTRFGAGAKFGERERRDHPVLEDPDWGASRFLRSLQPKAEAQLGTSGSGNHFVEWGTFSLREEMPDWGLGPGEYLALLSHSGSRGVGHKIASEFSRLAQTRHPSLAPSVRHLAWLDLDDDAGREYWLAMELAGRFASACHAVIHREVARAAGLREAGSVENHHNFAWREELPDGTPVIVHRKGATPAAPGVLGVIPGSMADPGFLVRGKGEPSSLNSASHGAGRRMSRRVANESITRLERNRYLEARGVRLLDGGLDESPQAYKSIEQVIAAQEDLVEIVGSFAPRIVLMSQDDQDI